MLKKEMTMVSCHCGSEKDFVICCEPFLKGTHYPQTPEALMRSRYTAYTLANIDYIQLTMREKASANFQVEEARRWAKKICWIKLCVMKSHMETENKGYVEFEAIFIEGNRLKSMHENSEFILKDGRWYYVDGNRLPSTYTGLSMTRTMSCPCGSLRKFKNCHGS